MVICADVEELLIKKYLRITTGVKVECSLAMCVILLSSFRQNILENTVTGGE